MRSPLPLSITSISRQPLYPRKQRVEIGMTQPWCFSEGFPHRQSLQIADVNQSTHLDRAKAHSANAQAQGLLEVGAW